MLFAIGEIMQKNVLDFLEAYKSLDEICKQILSSNRGISQYIDEMDETGQMNIVVPQWKEDFNQLKRMRRIRNQLVHEVNSFDYCNVEQEDIEWLCNFRSRILERKDPFALLHNRKNERDVKNDIYINESYEMEETIQFSVKRSILLCVFLFVIFGIMIIVLGRGI